jgi:hypothetical protein
VTNTELLKHLKQCIAAIRTYDGATAAKLHSTLMCSMSEHSEQIIAALEDAERMEWLDTTQNPEDLTCAQDYKWSVCDHDASGECRHWYESDSLRHAIDLGRDVASLDDDEGAARAARGGEES